MKLRQVAFIFGALALIPAIASASAIMRIEDVGSSTGVLVVDNGAGDINPLVGVITFSGSVGSFLINVTTGVSQPVISGSPPGSAANIDLNSINVLTSGTGTIQMTFMDTGFSFPSSLLQLAVGGTLTAPSGSTALFQSWANLGNLVPSGPFSSPPAGSTPACSPPGVAFGPGAFSTTCTTSFFGDTSYSLFSQATIFFGGPGSVSFNLDTQANTPVPEPGSMALLGMGLFGLAAAARRRIRSKRG